MAPHPPGIHNSLHVVCAPKARLAHIPTLQSVHLYICTFVHVLRAKAKATSFSREESIIESLKPYMFSCLRSTLFCLIIQFKEFYLCES